jgi:hypothetical protein
MRLSQKRSSDTVAGCLVRRLQARARPRLSDQEQNLIVTPRRYLEPSEPSEPSEHREIDASYRVRQTVMVTLPVDTAKVSSVIVHSA